MNVGSLFSGIGGIEIGFEAQGFTTEWFVEYDLYAQTILRKRFPYAKIYGDITQLDFRTVPKVDILTGGFPCQDISNAGKRVGITGSRSSLWKYYAEAIRILRPKYALIENVSAILGRGLDVVLADLTSLGYDAEWHCVSSSAVGALHRRDRIFIIAYSNKPRWEEQRKAEMGHQEYPQELSKTNSNGFSPSEHGEFQGEHNLSEEWKTKTSGKWEERINETSKPSTDIQISNSPSFRLEEQESKQRLYTWEQETSLCNSERFGRSGESWGRSRQKFKNRCIWATEPSLGRVAHGVSHRVDRIKCLGNAVVPQVAEIFGQAIKIKETNPLCFNPSFNSRE